jgi:hypothetical protein
MGDGIQEKGSTGQRTAWADQTYGPKARFRTNGLFDSPLVTTKKFRAVRGWADGLG